jgi:hypothetical protein
LHIVAVILGLFLRVDVAVEVVVLMHRDLCFCDAFLVLQSALPLTARLQQPHNCALLHDRHHYHNCHVDIAVAVYR